MQIQQAPFPAIHTWLFQTTASWSLQSILLGRDRRVAVINGTRVREGDRIGSAQVVRIDDSRVLIKTGGRTLTLYLLPETMKVRP